jgi:hypothetical protein
MSGNNAVLTDAEKTEILRASMLNIGRLLPAGMEVNFFREEGDPRARMQIYNSEGTHTEYAFSDHGPLFKERLESLSHAGYMAFGMEEGKRVPLHEYAGPTENAVKGKILDVARREGYAGTVAGRMLELGWWIAPVYTISGKAQCGEEGDGVAGD